LFHLFFKETKLLHSEHFIGYFRPFINNFLLVYLLVTLSNLGDKTFMNLIYFYL
jgi:hypothetical protein